MKPLLAEKVDLDNLRFPYLVSPKYDGFRCVVDGYSGEPTTRSLKPVPNTYVRGKLAEMKLNWLDGELLTYTNGKLDDFNVVQSKLATRAGMPDFRLMVFDCFKHPSWGFQARLAQASLFVDQMPADLRSDRVQTVCHTHVDTLEALMEAEDKAVSAGWEGLMLRSLDGKYKFGRSTVNEGILLKLKRTDDDEAVVVGLQERFHNANEAKTSNLGYTERSSHRENMVPCGDLGALNVRWRDVEFDVGTGFTAEQRRLYYDVNVLGKTVTFGYQGVGSRGKPRFPRFKGFRSAVDL